MKLNEAYSKNDFKDFLTGFLPDDFSLSEKELVIGNNYKNIKSGLVLGESKSLGIKVFYLEHEKEKDPRVALTTEAFKILSENWAKKALVVFNSKNSENWRLSLMTISFDINEKNKIVSNLSNPKRKSFFLGPNAKIATANQFLLNKEKVKDYEDLESRFDVEIVTKEFFNNYKKLYEKILNYLKNDKAFKIFSLKHGLELETFAKKLLGQIVFIYFLQKKGWLGAKKGENISNGDKGFLRSLFDKCEKDNRNFFNDYLEHLFYDCLNKIPNRAGSFYRERFDCKIPFLNGGLFEPINNYRWQEEFINIPNDIFSNKEEKGILDVFDLYNFTIDENTPDDQEISVDPEMLGKVFENLLKSNTRKGQGAFYTPREIVRYMCQESLINYLMTDTGIKEEKIRDLVKGDLLRDVFDENSYFKEEFQTINDSLKKIKAVDPACGSGAFLLGLLQEIVKVRSLCMSLCGENNIDIYQIKKETIQNCLYGVDIDSGAIDIAKLRFWLSIVVEENIEDIEPLPNLDYKIMQGNSLLEDLVIGDSVIPLKFEGKKKMDGRTKEKKDLFAESHQTKLFIDESETLVDKLEKYHTEYFHITDPDKKKVLKKRIDNVEDELIQIKCKEEIERAESFIRNNPNDSKKILKNTEKILAIKEVLSKWKKDHLRPFFPWKLHFSEVFNRENVGFDIVIANPPYEEISLQNGKKMFQKIYPDVLSGHYDLYIFFFRKAFDISKQGAIISFITPHTYLHYTQYKNLREFIYKNSHIREITSRISGVFDSAVVDNAIIVLQVGDGSGSTNFSQKEIKNQNLINVSREDIDKNSFDEDSFDLGSIKNLRILKKFMDGSDPLGEIVESSQGITVYARVQGEKINYFRNTKEDEYCQPFIKGRDIQRYVLEWKNSYIKYGGWLWCPRNNKFFENEKLFFRQTADRLIGTYEKKPMYCIDSVHSIIKKNDNYSLKFILAILNSRFGDYLYKLLITETGKVFAQVKLTFLRRIPVKRASLEQQKPFIEITDKILEITKSDDYISNPEKQVKVQEYEKQIDRMVYELYGLTDEEIKIVERK